MKKALIIVDMQNDFMPKGTLPVAGADEIAPIINELMSHFDFVIATVDFHPIDHISFACNHGKFPGQKITVKGVEQMLWPTHCVQDSLGAELIPSLDRKKIDHKVYKGVHSDIDSYSAFFDNARESKTDLESYLKKNQVKELFFVGVATEVCVLFSVLDALKLGFSVSVFPEACRGISLDSEKKAFAKMEGKGAKMASVKNFL